MNETPNAESEERRAKARKRLIMAARRLAVEEGHAWKTMAKEERKPFRMRARELLKARRAARTK